MRRTIDWTLVLRVKNDDAAAKVMARLEQAAKRPLQIRARRRDPDDVALLRVRATTELDVPSFAEAVVAALATAFRVAHSWTVYGDLQREPGERNSAALYEHVVGELRHSPAVSGLEKAFFELEDYEFEYYEREP